MKNITGTKNPYLLFLPFLIFYSILILIFGTNELRGDESRYLTYAHNIINGFYSPPAPHIDLGNGPGYPIILVPFVALNLSHIYLQLLNAVLYYLSIVMLFKSLKMIVSVRFTIIFSLFWACYPTYYEEMTYVLPEILSVSLIPLIIFTTLKTFSNIKNSKKFVLLSGITFGFLALTKPIFGYVLMFMIIGAGVLWIANRKSINYRKSFTILLVALITTVPYLAYTYHLTGKIFYWSSFGGNNLYWMSTPYEGEYGSWIGFPVSPENSKYLVPGSVELITQRHQKDFDEIFENKAVQEANIINGERVYNITNGIKQDDLLKKIAVQNIKSHPFKFLQNCFSNAGRIIFNFPYSYSPQKPGTLLRLPINGTIIVFLVFCLIPTYINWQKILFPIKFLLFIASLYFGGSLLGSADYRMFIMMVPILLVWIAYIIEKSIKFKLRFDL